MSKIKRLLNIATRKKVKVSFRKSCGRYLGWYDDAKHYIVVERGRRAGRDILYTLAHELGHAHYRHGHDFYDGSNQEIYDALLQQEIDAWNYASRLARRHGFFNKYFIKTRNIGIYDSERVFRKDWLNG